VLIAADGKAKLADFGAAKRIPTLQSAGIDGNGNDTGDGDGSTLGNASDLAVGGESGPGNSSSGGPGDVAGKKEEENNKVRGTPLWMAPEVLRESTASWGWRQADVWSFACTVVSLVCKAKSRCGTEEPFTLF